MARKLDIEGLKFFEWTVERYSHSNSAGTRMFVCKCSCGNKRIHSGCSIKRGDIKRCKECADKRLITHGKTNSREYGIWQGMIYRCSYLNNKDWNNYGGRGITVCERWLKFENFYEDMGDSPLKYQIDRIDNDKGYSKENCRWVSAAENSRNKRGCSRCNCRCRIERLNNIS